MTTTLIAPYADLVTAAKRLAHTTSTRPVMPVLRYAVLDTSGTDPVLRSRNHLENWTELTVDRGVATGPNTLLPVAELVKALRSIKGATSAAKAREETISLTRGGTDLTVSGFGRTLLIRDLIDAPVEDYPAWPTLDHCNAVAELASEELSAALTFAETAVGKDDTLPMLTGIKLDGIGADARISYAATDQYRLTVTETDGALVDFNMLLPQTALPAIRALTGRVTISKQPDRDRCARFAADNGTVVARLLDANFPDYRSLLPTGGLPVWEVRRAGLLEDVQAVAGVIDKRAPVIIDFDHHGYTVDGCTHRNTSNAGLVEWRSGFNPAYLTDGLKSFKSEHVTISAAAANKPYLINGQRPDGADGLYLIMPMRLPDVQEAA